MEIVNKKLKDMRTNEVKEYLYHPRNIGDRRKFLMSYRVTPGKMMFFEKCEARKARPQLEMYGFILGYTEVQTEGQSVTCVLPRFTSTDLPMKTIQGYDYVKSNKVGVNASRNYLKTRLSLPGLVLVETPKGLMDVRQAVKNNSGGRVVLHVQ